MKTLVLEADFDENWLATISFGENTNGTVALPGYEHIGYKDVAISLQALADDEFGVSAWNLIPLLIYKIDDVKGLHSIHALPLGHAHTVGNQHYVSTYAINPKTKFPTTVTFNLKRGEGKKFTLTLIQD